MGSPARFTTAPSQEVEEVQAINTRKGFLEGLVVAENTVATVECPKRRLENAVITSMATEEDGGTLTPTLVAAVVVQVRMVSMGIPVAKSATEGLGTRARLQGR